MVDRNPSPPPEFEKDLELYRADSVGQTAISKHWVLTTLMSIVKDVEEHKDKEDDVVDVGDEIQDAACKLWDICMDPEVAEFLLGCDILEILFGVIIKSKSPRITEISVGILGNMACNNKVCKDISMFKELRTTIVALLSSTDTQTLIEVVRLLRISLSNEASSPVWVETVLESEEFIQDFSFILKSSTNSKLLSTASELIDLCLDLSSALLDSVATTEFTNSLVECGEQLFKNKAVDKSFEKVCHSLHAIHSISTLEKGIQALREMKKNIFSLFRNLCSEWMASSLESGDGKEMQSDEVSVSCFLSVILKLLEEVATDEEFDDKDKQMLVKFCQSLVQSKGDVARLKHVTGPPKSFQLNEDRNEFRTPLLPFKNSPCILPSPASTPVKLNSDSENTPTRLNALSPTCDKKNSDSPAKIKIVANGDAAKTGSNFKILLALANDVLNLLQGAG